jgi:hypothetical protein
MYFTHNTGDTTNANNTRDNFFHFNILVIKHAASKKHHLLAYLA